MLVAGIVASEPGGTTDALVTAILAGAEEAGAATGRVHLGRGSYDHADIEARLEALGRLDGLVLGTPMYRGTFTGNLKELLDHLPRGGPAEGFAGPLRARAVAVAGTGASDHHYLGIDPLASMLTRFFAAFVVPGGVYAQRAHFADDGQLRDERVLQVAGDLGRRVVALAAAIGADDRLADAAPQV